MSSNRNTMNNNLFCGYQQYVECHRQAFSFATHTKSGMPLFFGSIAPLSTSSLSSNMSPASGNNSIMSPPPRRNNNSIMSPPSTIKNVERE